MNKPNLNRVIFAGTPEFSTEPLKALIKEGYDLIAVYTQPDRPRGRGKKLAKSPVKELAELHGIPVYQPQTLRSDEAQQEFSALNADIMVVVAYGLILPEPILNAPRLGCINIHASLLPRWRGAAPIHRAIEMGDKESGIAIMQMDKGLDTGAVWGEAKLTISNDMTTGQLHDELKVMGAQLLIKTLPKIFSGEYNPQPQVNEGITYAEKITKEEAKISWHETAELIERKIRAFNPVPTAYSYWRGQPIKIWSAQLTNIESDHTIGTLEVITGQLYVNTGSHKLIIKEIQPAGKRAMFAEDFIKGNVLNLEVLNDE